MRVLIGVDGSQASLAALDLASRLTRPSKEELLLYYSPPVVRAHRASSDRQSVVENSRSMLLKAVFDRSLASLPESHRACSSTIEGTAKPSRGVLLAANEYRADLVVVGTHGASPLSPIFLGSVARSVVHGALVPVLVTRTGTKPTRSDALRVLLACDGSHVSQCAGRFLKSLAWPEGSKGFVVRVFQGGVVPEIPEWLEEQARESGLLKGTWRDEVEKEKHQLERELQDFCQDLPGVFLASPPIVSVGHPADQILRTIESHEIDLVVVGARRRGPASRLFFGSTSEAILNRAKCSMLIVPEREPP